MPGEELTHIDGAGLGRMVDVGAKVPTVRVASARATMHLGAKIMAKISGGELVVAKGGVFQTAIIAGTMAAKRTSDLIPLCHPLAITGCTISIVPEDLEHISLECRVTVEGKTGVEMEALTGVSVAALTVYDMCKAMSHEIAIRDLHLVEKTGGKHDYHRQKG